MKEISLTQGKVVMVDDTDYDWLNQWKWIAHYDKKGKRWYAHRTEHQGCHTVTLCMHRLIMGTPKGMQTDHIDHDGLHNWRGNLRVCTTAQNQHNALRRSDNTSGYKGVSLVSGKWRAMIAHEGKQYWLGQFATPEEAASAYNEAAIAYYGEFALFED